MFWRFGGYANISAVDTILDKGDFALEEILDEADTIQELKQHNSKLLDYLRQREVLAKLLDYVVVPKLEPVAVPEDGEDDGQQRGRVLPFGRARASSRNTDSGNEEEEAEKKRNKYAYVATEVLSSENWSISEALMDPSNRDLLYKFWKFLERPTPLDPLGASYFTKVNEGLFDKKTEEMVEFLKTVDGAIANLLRHVDCPMVMDLLLKIISLERTDHGQGIVEWLYAQNLMPSLLSFLGPEHSWATQTAAGDFLKAIITVSANASQNEQACIGPNELTRQLVSRACVEQLIQYMLGGGNALTVGVGIVIEVIRKNNSDYDPDVGAEANLVPSSRDPIYLGTLLRIFAENVPNFMRLIMHAPAPKAKLDSTFGAKIEPLGFDRFKTCELMAELLHCSNMGLLNEVGSEEFIAARDAERQRLRDEGKLTAVRGEESPSSGEDLSMRISQSSPVGEVRRLEVTNVSDDDGFEEVTHSREMNEDTSHEFVKAEEEIPVALPTSSFMDKDEDDFVDEPLSSSPRLHIRETMAADDPQFEEPDLVVAPLSPSKKKPVLFDGSDDKEAETTVKTSDEQYLAAEKSIVAETALQESTNTQHEDSVVSTKAEKEVAPTDIPAITTTLLDRTARADTENHETGPGASMHRDLSPHAEDIPAPLFSQPTAAKADVEKAPEVTPTTSKLPAIEAAATESGVDLDETIDEAGEASIIVGHRAEPSAPVGPSQIQPVVGDYLKMQFVEHKVVPTVLTFFFKYQWNNFLHNVVYDIVQQVFNGPMDRGFNPTLAISLFDSADVTTQIIDGQIKSEESQKQNKTRMGYMGHLTLIAEEVVKFTERHPPELLSDTVLNKVMAQKWIEYVEGALAETRERDNAILGGVRPETLLHSRAGPGGGLAAVGLTGLGGVGIGSSQSASSALAQAGLGGGGGGLDPQGSGDGANAFSISAGISSGFHSSSDEEDEADEHDEDIKNEFRAYTDPLNASSSSMDPPSIPPPPPPPPLNIPPSRARLQLAARLAKRQNANQQENGGETSTDQAGESTLQPAPVVERERLHNPFADDEDDEDDVDDNSDDDELGLGRGAGGWGRGSWWRDVVRRRPGRGRGAGGAEEERAGDESDEDSDRGEDDDDEEFGDFAMPEAGAGKASQLPGPAPDAPSAAGGIDRERERILLKPLPVHPPPGGTAGATGSKFAGLWPFVEGLSFGAGNKEKEGAGTAVSAPGDGGEAKEAVPSGPQKEVDEDVEIIGEDGRKVSRAVEAKRRTSIEDPDDDEVVV